MITRTTSLISMLIIAIFVSFAQPALANEGDRIWEAGGTLGGVAMKAKYKESPENNLLDQTLEVQIDNAPANLMVNVYLNGKRIGSMTTDVTGTGHFRADIFGVVPGPDGRPQGVRINDGDVISVGRGGQRVSGTFMEVG